jgi:hypothetical protein
MRLITPVGTAKLSSRRLRQAAVSSGRWGTVRDPKSGEFSDGFVLVRRDQVDGVLGVIDTRKVTFGLLLGKDARYGR